MKQKIILYIFLTSLTAVALTILGIALFSDNIDFLAYIPVIVVVGILVLIICVIMGNYLSDKLIRPINETAENMTENLKNPAYRELAPFSDEIRDQHEKVLAATTMRQDFIANVSHELKTPLTAISGYAELLENGMIDKDEEARIAGQIHDNCSRLLSLINDTIRLSELDHTEIPRNFSSIDLYALAEERCKSLQAYARAHRVLLSYGGRPISISADTELVRELVDNLLQNAIRYNKENGYVRLLVSSENGHAVLSVSDSGIGIPEDQQGRVFERFYRVDKSRSRQTGGTGLGLSIVKHICEIHNASIRLDSKPGEGTTFTVTF